MTSTMQWHHVCLMSFTLVEQFQFVTIDLYIQGRFFIFYEEGLGDSSFQPVGIVFGENGEFRRWRRSEVICFKIDYYGRTFISTLVLFNSFPEANLCFSYVINIFIIVTLVVINNVATVMIIRFIFHGEKRRQFCAFIHHFRPYIFR